MHRFFTTALLYTQIIDIVLHLGEPTTLPPPSPSHHSLPSSILISIRCGRARVPALVEHDLPLRVGPELEICCP